MRCLLFRGDHGDSGGGPVSVTLVKCSVKLIRLEMV